MRAARIRIEVVFALPERQATRTLTLPEGSTVADAVRASGLARDFPQIDASQVGIFGKLVRPDTRLHDRERVEIYRPLHADPKELRRRRAKR